MQEEEGGMWCWPHPSIFAWLYKGFREQYLLIGFLLLFPFVCLGLPEIGTWERTPRPREMASEDKQCRANSVEVKLEFSDCLKPVMTDARPAAAVAVAAVERALMRSISWLPLLSFAFMVYSAITAIIESKGERGTVLFVTGSFTLLGLLFLCMKMFEETRGVPSRKGTLLKVAVWILSVGLTMLFSYRVTTIVDSPILDVFVWTVAVLTSAFGCYLLFLHE